MLRAAICVEMIILVFSLLGLGTQITGVTWDPDMHVIHITLDSWPGNWDGWKFYLNGMEIPMEGGPGAPVIRPDAPLSQPPTGLIVGTLPWVTGLDAVDFPCCGTIRLYIPDEGLTAPFSYSLVHLGCTSASPVKCTSEWTVHSGDLIIPENTTRTIADEKFFQKGNVYVRDHATLMIKNSEFMMARGHVPTVHVYFFVDSGAKLIIDNSKIYPPPPSVAEPGLICVMNHGSVEMRDSDTQIHYFDMSGSAQFTMSGSRMVNPIGGLLQVTGGETHVTDSTIGALGLLVPAGAHLDVSGLHSGMHFQHFDVHQIIPEAGYVLTLDDTTLLKDELSGEYKYGPYERGWIFFLDPDCHAQISNCELRKVFIDVRNDTAEFHNLKVGVPSSLTYRDIQLKDVTVMGEWPFTVTDANMTIYDSNYLFLQPSGHSIIHLVRSHMVEFIPRDFFGTLVCDHARWTEAGEIIGGVPYHSNANAFTIKGSLTISGLRENLQWKDAQVKREFTVHLTDHVGKPIAGAKVRVGGDVYLTDSNGLVQFTIRFDETNYASPTEITVSDHGVLIARREIDFFSPSPIEIIVN